MIGISALMSIAGGITGLIKETVSGWNERRRIRTESELKIQQAKAEHVIRKVEKGQDADIRWDQLMATGSQHSWKDEYLTIILSIPLILCFIPGMPKYIKDGFEALQTTPEWYKAAFGIVVAASFGYRRFVDIMAKRKK